jgi:hypothetical protein
MNFFKTYDLLIGILMLSSGLIILYKSRNLDDIPEKKGHYSSKVMARKFSILLIALGIFIIIAS